MPNHPRISKLLVETGAYRDLNDPVILTSGAIGIYYINTEKLVQDDGRFERFGDGAGWMYRHAVAMSRIHPTFNEAIQILAEKAYSLIPPDDLILPNAAISGGQRRDWLFSMPVAQMLGLPHISLYKPGANARTQVIGPDGKETKLRPNIVQHVVHIADLLTEGSSVYSEENGISKGWLPRIWNYGDIKDLLTVVSRKQGGEERLAAKGVTVHPFVTIDEDFLREHSTDPQRALEYFANPDAWSEEYLEDKVRWSSWGISIRKARN